MGGKKLYHDQKLNQGLQHWWSEKVLQDQEQELDQEQEQNCLDKSKNKNKIPNKVTFRLCRIVKVCG